VFVFIDTFKAPENVDLLSRMTHTLTTAGRSTFFTSLTSILAFVSNVVSEIPALFDFGLLTALIVLANYLLVLTLTPAMLSLWWRFVMPAERWVWRTLTAPCRRCRAQRRSQRDAQTSLALHPGAGEDVKGMERKDFRRRSKPVHFEVVLADQQWGGGGALSSKAVHLPAHVGRIIPHMCIVKHT